MYIFTGSAIRFLEEPVECDLPVTPASEHDDVTAEICGSHKSGLSFLCDGSSYSMTSPSYSSASSLHSESSSAVPYAPKKPSYDPPNLDWPQPSTSCGPETSTDKIQKKAKGPVYSPSSPSSDSSSSISHAASLLLRGCREDNTPCSTRTSLSARMPHSEAFSNPQINCKSSRPNLRSKKYKKKSTFASLNKHKLARHVASDLLVNQLKTIRVLQSYSRSPPIPELDGMPSAQSDVHGVRLHSAPSLTKSPSSFSKSQMYTDAAPRSPLHLPSSLTGSQTSPVYSSPKHSPQYHNRSFSPSPQLHHSEWDSHTKGDTSPDYSESMSKQSSISCLKLLRSPVYSPSSPSPSYSPTYCTYSSPNHSPPSKKSHKSDLTCAGTSSSVIRSPLYSPSSPSKQLPLCPEFANMKMPHSPPYYPSSPSLPLSLTSSPQKLQLSPPEKHFLFSPSSEPCPTSLSSSTPSPSFSLSSPSKAPPTSSSNAPLSPDFTPSSPSKPPPSPSMSPGFHSSPSNSPSQIQDDVKNVIMSEYKASSSHLPRSPQNEDSSSLYSPVSSQSPVYSSDSSSKQNSMLKKRVKLQRSSPTSPGSLVSELMEIGVSKSSSAKKLKLYSPSSSQQQPYSLTVQQSGNGSPELSVPSPKYSPSSKMISSEVSEAVVPPYSPSSPSHPPPSPSLNPSSPPSPVSSDRFSLSKVKARYTPEPASHRPPSYGSPHYSLDSLSSYSSSSFSSGLPSPSSGSPRYSPSLSDSEAQLNHRLTPSPPLSPAVMLTSPRVSSSSSSSPVRGTPPELPGPPPQESNHPPDIALPASLSMFSPSLSPQLPQFSPSSPSHQPPSPAYSPPSPSYSSGSCSPSASTSSSYLGNMLSSSPSSTSTEPSTVVLKVFIPKST